MSSFHISEIYFESLWGREFWSCGNLKIWREIIKIIKKSVKMSRDCRYCHNTIIFRQDPNGKYLTTVRKLFLLRMLIQNHPCSQKYSTTKRGRWDPFLKPALCAPTFTGKICDLWQGFFGNCTCTLKYPHPEAHLVPIFLSSRHWTKSFINTFNKRFQVPSSAVCYLKQLLAKIGYRGYEKF